jgi:hypothetical protein
MTMHGGFGRRFFILTKYGRNAALPPLARSVVCCQSNRRKNQKKLPTTHKAEEITDA